MSTQVSRRGSSERYDAEFKQEAVRLLLTSGKTASQLARELGVSSWSLSRWKQEQLQTSGAIEVEGQMRLVVEVEQENRQLRRELEVMRRQRDLLPSAIAICSEDGLGQDGLGQDGLGQDGLGQDGLGQDSLVTSRINPMGRVRGMR